MGGKITVLVRGGLEWDTINMGSVGGEVAHRSVVIRDEMRLEAAQITIRTDRTKVEECRAEFREPFADERRMQGVEVAAVDNILKDGGADWHRVVTENHQKRTDCPESLGFDKTTGGDSHGGDGEERADGDEPACYALEPRTVPLVAAKKGVQCLTLQPFSQSAFNGGSGKGMIS